MSIELGLTFSEACAEDPKTRIVFISKKALVEIAGTEVEKHLYEEAIAAKMKGKRREFKQLEFEEPEKIFLPKLTSLQPSSILQPIALIGDFGYVGKYNQAGGSKRSVKVVWKDRACSNRKEETVLRERNLLAAASMKATKSGVPSLLPIVESSFQNDKSAFLIFSDLFVCDLVSVQSSCYLYMLLILLVVPSRWHYKASAFKNQSCHTLLHVCSAAYQQYTISESFTDSSTQDPSTSLPKEFRR